MLQDSWREIPVNEVLQSTGFLATVKTRTGSEVNPEISSGKNQVPESSYRIGEVVTSCQESVGFDDNTVISNTEEQTIHTTYTPDNSLRLLITLVTESVSLPPLNVSALWR